MYEHHVAWRGLPQQRDQAICIGVRAWNRYHNTPEKDVLMCDDCVAVHEQAVCRACWARDWSRGCLSCRQALPASRSADVRFCHACFRRVFGVADECTPAASCFYCHGRDVSVSTRRCTHEEGCAGLQ